MTAPSIVISQQTHARAARKPGVGRPLGYHRAWDLPRILAVWPQELADLTLAGRERMLTRLKQALRAERQRGIAGHWTYDVSRHAQLITAFKSEAREVAEQRKPGVRQESLAEPARPTRPHCGT